MAEPEKSIRSPTAHVVEELGVEIVGTGGALAVAVTLIRRVVDPLSD